MTAPAEAASAPRKAPGKGVGPFVVSSALLGAWLVFLFVMTIAA